MDARTTVPQEVFCLQTSIFDWFGYRLDAQTRFRMIAEAGFDQVLLWWGDEYAQTAGPKETQPAIARAHGLAVENVHAPFADANLLWLDGQDGDDLLQRYLACVADCAAHAIPTVVMHLTRGDTPPPISARGMDRLRRLAEAAERWQVTVALENLRRPAYLAAVYTQVDSPRLRLCYDSGHQHCYTPTQDILACHGQRLAALHLHDNDTSDDQHRLPGDGTLDWTALTGRLRALRYPGPVTLEVSSECSPRHERETPEAFLRDAFARARALVTALEDGTAPVFPQEKETNKKSNHGC